MKWPAIALLLLATASPASAQGADGFQSPSGNIFCMYFADADGQSLRCDIRETSNRAPAAPADCDLDWGNAFEITARSRRGVRICHGDTVQDPGLPVLGYGLTFNRGAFVCTSDRSGVSCSNARGAGFRLSRAEQKLF